MKQLNSLRVLSLSTAICVSLLCAGEAYAYIGPGAGVALIGTFFGFTAALFATLAMVLAWPVWIVWKKYKAKKQTPPDPS